MTLSEGEIGLVVFGVVTLATTTLVHWRLRRYVLASFLGAILASLLFQLFAVWHLGHLDAFAVIGFVVSLAITMPVAFGVGWIFVMRRKARV